MKKVLFIANHKGFSKFNAPFMSWFKMQGWQVDNASPGIETGDVDNQFDVCISRSPFSKDNLKAYKQLKRIIKEGDYDIIHVHTPMGAVLGRLAARRARKKGTKIIYTAHGFHFFNGAPLLYWLLYYPIEKLLAQYTDTLVTINEEDFEFAKRKKLAKKIYHIDGVGVNLTKFHSVNSETKKLLRSNFNLDDNDFVVLYTAQFIDRKNHKYILNNLPEIIKKIPNIKFLFAGSGETLDYCKSFVTEHNFNNYISFLGERRDIPELCEVSDVHLSTSKQEGLGICNVEAMASGCALVLSKIRGHIDVCTDGVNGFLFDLSAPNKMIESLERLYKDRVLLNQISLTNIASASKFSVQIAVEKMAKIYTETLL